eukprot:scaffold620008_cov51-Prasinocladus_malaysianus.AAC.1
MLKRYRSHVQRAGIPTRLPFSRDQRRRSSAGNFASGAATEGRPTRETGETSDLDRIAQTMSFAFNSQTSAHQRERPMSG